MDLDKVQKTIKQLSAKKNELEEQRRELKFKLEKANEELASLETQVQEVFGTTDVTELEAILENLTKEAETILKEIEDSE